MSPTLIKAHLGRSVAVTFHLIATPLGIAMGSRRRPRIGRPSLLHIPSLGEE